jgi:predicted DNA-binding transcriptional regulator YafY
MTTPETRRVQPYHLACIQNQWYLFGRCLQREAVRTFALPRIQSVETTATSFQRPADFTLEKFLGSSFGIFVGEGDYHVKIHFTAQAAGLVRERFWHHTQVINELPNQELELTVHLASLEDIASWVLSWGSQARALAPAALVERLAKEHRAAAAAYATANG